MRLCPSYVIINKIPYGKVLRFMHTTKKGKKFYLALVIFCLTGQIAWVVENMYFNVFIYKMFNASAEAISTMVAASAIAATVTIVLDCVMTFFGSSFGAADHRHRADPPVPTAKIPQIPKNGKLVVRAIRESPLRKGWEKVQRGGEISPLRKNTNFRLSFCELGIRN